MYGVLVIRNACALRSGNGRWFRWAERALTVSYICAACFIQNNVYFRKTVKDNGFFFDIISERCKINDIKGKQRLFKENAKDGDQQGEER